MTAADGQPEDRYARVDYRRLIAWEGRIEREGPWLLELLGRAPDRSVLDVGCGTGEHVAWLAGQGARAVGIDSSPSMIGKAKEHERAGRGRFVLGDATRAREVLGSEPPFGLALCLGNVLPHLTRVAEAAALFREVHALLRPGGFFLVQVLNYRRILDQGIRHLPLNFREDDPGGEEVVFLRLLQPLGEGLIRFLPTTLAIPPDREAPAELRAAKSVVLRAWTAEDLRPLAARAGFAVAEHGDLRGGPFDPATSTDLVLLAGRAWASAYRSCMERAADQRVVVIHGQESSLLWGDPLRGVRSTYVLEQEDEPEGPCNQRRYAALPLLLQDGWRVCSLIPAGPELAYAVLERPRDGA